MRLGILHVRRDILRGLTAEELREWQHYAALEPFDETRQDYRIASILQMLFNINRGKNTPAGKLQDFVLQFGEQPEKPKQTPEQQISLLKLLSMMHANEVVPDVPTKVISEGPSEEAIQAAIEQAKKAMN